MQTKHYPVAILLAVFVIASTFYLNSLIAPGASASPHSVVEGISPDRYLNNVTYLSRDEMKGRGNGSPELEKAADFIASQFRIFGLRPAGEGNTYFQHFQVTTGTQFGSKNELTLNGTALKVNEDFVPISFSNTAQAEGSIVFAGYGITAPEMHYDDYQGIDAKDKIVVVFRHEPQETDPHSPFAGTNFTQHASFINKAINARLHGAKGIVFITDPNNHSGEEDTVGPATKNSETDDVGIPSLHARRELVASMFAKLGKNLSDIQKKIDADLKSQSFDVAARATVATDVVRTRKTVRNVVAALPGSDPQLRDEWVVVGAHYDHLGLGDRSSLAPSQIGEIHHGADDNASGTAGVLEIARLASMNRQLKRSVLFMTFAGEELGLLGSAFFVSNPTIPADHIVGMINMDMIGRVQNDRLFVGGVGTSPSFKPWVEELNKDIGLNLDYSDSGYGSSDHTSFTVKRIPILFFFSGLHTDYHKPSDTYDKINAEGAKKVLSLSYLMLDRISNNTERPQYTEVRQQQAPAGSGGGGYGPDFGSIPDFRDDLKGVLFAGVRPNSPADKAGLKPGDLMTGFDGKSIQNLYDFTYALRSKKPGDLVVVVVKRNGQELKVDVTLEARK